MKYSWRFQTRMSSWLTDNVNCSVSVASNASDQGKRFKILLNWLCHNLSSALATWMPFWLTSFSIFWLIVLFVYHLKKNIVAEIIFSCQKTHQSNEGNKSCVRKISTVEMGGGGGKLVFFKNFWTNETIWTTSQLPGGQPYNFICYHSLTS